jgi:DNA-binding CsgD family transcriptional regulator
MAEGFRNYRLPDSRLSALQLQVIGGYATGLCDSDIAKGLGVDAMTVNKRSTDAQVKLNVCNIGEAVIAAFEGQQLDPDSFGNDDDLIKIKLLTRREREIFGLIYQYRGEYPRNALICGDLVIAPSTLNKHIGNINGKLGIVSQTRAIVLYHYAELRGFI